MTDTDKNPAGSFLLSPWAILFLPQATTPMYCFMLIRSRIKVKRYAVININKGFLMFISLLAISH